MIECAYFGFQCSHKEWDQVEQGHEQGAGSLGNGFHHKDAAPHPTPLFPYENVKNKR